MAARDFMPGEDVVAVIRGDLERYEIERAEAHRQVSWRVPVFLGALFVGAILAAVALATVGGLGFLSTPHIFLYAGTVFAASAVYGLAMRPATELSQSLRDRLLPMIFAFVDDLRYRNGVTPDTFERLPEAAVGGFSRQTFDDVISGRYEGFPFELYEARLSQKSSKSETTIFKGVVLAFGTGTAFPGLLVAAKKTGAVNRFFRDIFSRGDLREVISDHADLDAVYEFRTDNVEAALPVVDGKLAKVLRWLNETWPGEPSRIALQGSDGFVLLPLTRNFFELPPISTAIDYRAHIEPLVADMVSLLATAALARRVGAAEGGEEEARD